MGKSIRSKHRQKMRGIIRKKNEKRVLEMLHNTIKNAKCVVTEDMVKFKKFEELKKERKEKEEKELAEAEAKKRGVPMEVVTKTNPNWDFPSWATGRDIRRMKRQRKYLKLQRKKLRRQQKIDALASKV